MYFYNAVVRDLSVGTAIPVPTIRNAKEMSLCITLQDWKFRTRESFRVRTILCWSVRIRVRFSASFQCWCTCHIYAASPLVWKTWKCRGIWQSEGNVRYFTKSQWNVREKILSEKSGLKLFIVSCIIWSFLDFAEFVHFILVSDHALLHSYPTTDSNTSSVPAWYE